MRRFGISRDPLREAVRILEVQGIVELSRGRNGGVKLLSSVDMAAQEMLRTYWQLSGISLTELMEGARIFAQITLPEIVSSASREQIAAMRQHVRRARANRTARHEWQQALADLSNAVFAASKNAATRVFTQTLSASIEDFAYAGNSLRIAETRVDRNIDLFESVIDAIERRDVTSALRHAEQASVETLADLLIEEKGNPKTYNTNAYLLGNHKEALSRARGSQKGAIQLAYRVAAHIGRHSLPPGHKLDWAKASGAQSTASRALTREAIRLLEFVGVVEVKMGKRGGVYVTAPNPTRVSEWSKAYLGYLGVDGPQVNELRAKLEDLIARTYAPRLSSHGVLQLKSTLDDLAHGLVSSTASSAARQLLRSLYGLANNRALSLYGEILIDLSATTRRRPRASESLNVIRERIFECSMQLSTAFLKQDTSDMVASLAMLRSIANTTI